MAEQQRERDIAEMEAQMIHAENGYFEARPQIMRTRDKETTFEAGFKAAWEARALSHAEGEAVNWDDAQAVCDLPEVHDCLQCFSEDSTGDNGTEVVRAVMQATHPAPQVAVPELLVDMGRRMLADQEDNGHFTADPVFVVQRRRMVAGIDTDYDPEIGWLDEESNLIEGEERQQLEAGYQESGNVPEGYTRTGVTWEWEYVDTYLTIEAARARINGVPDGRVYVESAYRNHEMKAIREFLMSVAAAPTAPARAQPKANPEAGRCKRCGANAWMLVTTSGGAMDQCETCGTLRWHRARPIGEQPVSDPDGPGRVLMPRALTAENGAKAALSGEFSVSMTVTCSACHYDEPDDECEFCGGEREYQQSEAVSWTTIKRIYSAAVDLLSAPAPDEREIGLKWSHEEQFIMRGFIGRLLIGWDENRALSADAMKWLSANRERFISKHEMDAAYDHARRAGKEGE
ncbi:hypothetical protein [Alloalcanivorax xenomutans]